MPHVGIVLLLLRLYSAFNSRDPIPYFMSLLYLTWVLADSEILRLLNYVIEKLWPVCMEEYASKKIFQPTVDWILEKHKESTLKKALVQCLCLGSNPPTFTEVHVFRNSHENEGWVIEVGINFCAVDHMRSILAIKLRDRLGRGMWVKLDMKNLYVDGKVLIMVNFLNHWPFVRRVQVCFVEPPHFSMAVKPLFTFGLDVMEPPVIVVWLDKLLSIALKKMLVWPSALMFDMEKYASTCPESCFSLNAEEPDACVKVGAITTSGLKPPWFLVDWYVKVRLGNCLFRSSTQKTQSPSWDEEIRIPVTWELRDKIRVEVCYKGFLFDKTYGWSSLCINAVRDGRTHPRQLRLSNKERQYLHLSVTVLESNVPALSAVP
ncbi:C2 domain-containing protein At1g53590-like [Rhodamnia argentea]|uniref:C2 domain-containing protein At1g53590-like n=1 Tax=Rhodamnia argentea TaxID=178133 RepID=A0ABM3HBW7_9MYRT|nr:C2 domain-containing protein At1g53590-like [Rhodamnia argentea]